VSSLPALMLFVFCPASAFAHKLYVYPESIKGATIHGRAYFPGDVPAQHSDVIVRDVSGRELARTTTDDKGKFTFTAREHVDLLLVVETPDGHTGTYTVHASELPDSLPAGVPAAGSGSQVVSPATDPSVPAAAGKENELAVVRDQLTELSTQFELLRRQVSESDERLRFRDILGGIGFILGLAGVAFYMKARGNKT
jgi:nickel transport protein